MIKIYLSCRLFSAWICTGLCLSLVSGVQATDDALLAQFENPPHSARPHTWWHWMNGNITKEGIEKDLRWMQSIGLGGVQNFNVSLNTPRIVERPLDFITPEWKEAFQFAVRSAAEKELNFTIAASPGWSETGGPWVKPEDAMKKLVWAETTVQGGTTYSGKLPQLPNATGPFQDIEFHDPLAQGELNSELPVYSADARVLAYPSLATEFPVPMAFDQNGESLAVASLIDAELSTVANLPKAGEESVPTIFYRYKEPVTIRSATLYIPHAKPPFREPLYLPVLEARQGDSWLQVVDLPLTEVPTTVSFVATTAEEFRLRFTENKVPADALAAEAAPGMPSFDIFAQPAKDHIPVGQWRLSSLSRVNRYEAKAGFATVPNYYELGTGGVTVPGIAAELVIDLTDRVSADGTLTWNAPEGQHWRILRLGHSLTGKTNHPAPAEATGLEVDKYEAGAVRRYLETYLSMYREAVGEELMGERGLDGLLTDSIEVGASNWTTDMAGKFRKLRGYDPTPWLPVLTGALIGSVEQSEAFLYDFRLTLAELLAQEHYATVAKVAKENGLLVYGEALEDGRPVIGDDLAMRSHASVPMAAMWNYHRGASPRASLLGDMKGAASVAHIYGQNLVAAESMTAFMSPWAFAPSDLKRLIDLEFVYGVNRPVIHTSVHHPLDDKVPGLSLMVFGQYFNRHDTWASMAKPWIDYIARSSLLLQQGRYFADVAYFYGEESPVTALFKEGAIENLPTKYPYDFVNAEILQSQMSVKRGDLATKSGMRYKVLYLGGTSDRMTLPTLQRIAKLVKAGATVVGLPPKSSPALQDDTQAFKKLVDQLWSETRVTKYGKGTVFRTTDSEAVLGELGVAPDFEAVSESGAADLLFLHRKLKDADVWFLTNRKNSAETVEARFRVTGKLPQIWNAINGTVKPVSYRIEGGTTIVPLEMQAEDAFFVVFRDSAEEKSIEFAAPVERVVATISTPWAVQFQAGRGAPESTVMTGLKPLNESDDAGVRYFSGVATYHTIFELQTPVEQGARMFMDLGVIGDVAEVYVNGYKAGISWFPPYRIDVSEQLRPGANTLEVRVANLWVNRLIGDAQPGAEKLTFVAAPTYMPDAPLRPSGLIGPVQLIETH